MRSYSNTNAKGSKGPYAELQFLSSVSSVVGVLTDNTDDTDDRIAHSKMIVRTPRGPLRSKFKDMSRLPSSGLTRLNSLETLFG